MSSSLYRDAGCPSQCQDMYEYATVEEMNGITGAVPIPASTAQRIYQTPSTVNQQGQVVNPEMVQQVSQATGIAPAVVAQFIRMNRRF
jgi:hypothetical protein